VLPGKSRNRNLSLAASIAVVFACVLTIVSTYDRVSQTYDEPTHIATGLEWLQDGTYSMWTENPPLSRVPLALGPYYSGVRLPDEGRSKTDIEAKSWISLELGNRVLYENRDYRHRLALARAGTLPFFLLAAAVLWLWLARHNALSGFFAVATFCTLPVVLAHSALATTDMAFAAMFLLFIWRFVRWLQESTVLRSALLGVCLGLVVATKFTAIVFIPAAAFALIVARMWGERKSTVLSWEVWRSRVLHSLAITAPIGFFVLWGAYRFSVGTISALPSHLDDWVVYGPDAVGLSGALANAMVDILVPAPEFFHGVFVLLAHNDAGHGAYALGNLSDFGFWYFYPLALLVKTPFPFMIFVGAGLAAAVSRSRETPWWVRGVFGAIPLILLALLNSQVNIGLRHVLAVYGLAALASAAVVAPALERLDVSKFRVAGLFLLIVLTWQVAETALNSSSSLTYFNPIAGDEPGTYLVDSDLDWGQGVFELERFFSEQDATSLYVAYFGSAQLCEHDLPEIRGLEPNTPVQGWVAVSEFYYRDAGSVYWAGPPCDWDAQYSIERPETGYFHWLSNHEPVAILDGSIRVYHVE
jgi:4-amino-4-deoxy-L-arabinose transferase-like glycosyltransferase